MSSHASKVELIDAATGRTGSCTACGAGLRVTGDAERVWVECVRLADPRGPVARLLAALLPHRRELVLDLRP